MSRLMCRQLRIASTELHGERIESDGPPSTLRNWKMTGQQEVKPPSCLGVYRGRIRLWTLPPVNLNAKGCCERSLYTKNSAREHGLSLEDRQRAFKADWVNDGQRP